MTLYVLTYSKPYFPPESIYGLTEEEVVAWIKSNGPLYDHDYDNLRVCPDVDEVSVYALMDGK